MNRDKKEPLGIIEDAAGALSAYAVTRSATGNETAGILAGASAMLSPFLKTVRRLAADRLDARTTQWFEAIAHSSEKSTEDVINEVSERMNEPETRDVVIESVRSVEDVADEAVIPALGALAHMYLSEHRKPDWFFRGASRLLRDLSAEEFECLSRLVFGLETACSPIDPIDVWRVTGVEPSGVRIQWQVNGQRFEKNACMIDTHRMASRLFAALNANQLALSRSERATTDAFLIYVDTVSRLAKILKPAVIDV